MREIRCKIGIYGSVYDDKDTIRAYTYRHQPNNDVAYRLGLALTSALANNKSGDSIDNGLWLLKELESHGLGVFTLNDHLKGRQHDK